jgi:threonine/homoserine/homoserine lactone efflux protein
MSSAFLVTSLVVVVSPGTGVLYTLSAGIARGRRASVVAAFGCTLGIVPHVAGAIVGLAALLYASSVAFQTLKLLGVAYLLFVAWRTLREHGTLQLDPHPSKHVVPRAIAINVLNPKLSLFFFAFLPQFASTLPRMVELSAVFMALTFVVFVVYGQLAAGVRRHVLARPRVLTWLRRSFAAAFVALGARLAVAER